jgi:hypothetical protein
VFRFHRLYHRLLKLSGEPEAALLELRHALQAVDGVARGSDLHVFLALDVLSQTISQ